MLTETPITGRLPMVHRRHSPPEGTAAFNFAMRGVYEEPYRSKGRQMFYSVDSHGELIGHCIVPKGRDPAPYIEELWSELNDVDPIAAHDRPPFLRLEH